MATNKLNFLNCFTDYGNTGRSDCDIEEGFPKGDFLVPHGHIFSAADTATPASMAAALLAGLQSDNPDTAFYYLGDYDGFTATGEAPVVETYNSGRKREVRGATIGDDLLMTALSGAMQLHREQYKFNGHHREFDAVRLDVNNVLWFRTITTEAGVTTSAGRDLSRLNIGTFMKPDGSKGGQWTVSLEYKEASHINNSFAYLDMGDIDPLANGTGFIPVLLSFVSSSGPTNVVVKAKTGYGADLHDLFATELAQVTAHIFRNYLTNALITVTAAASTAEGWVITLAATGVDTDNPGTGGKVKYNYAAPSVLSAAPITAPGIKSNEIIITLG